MNNEASQTNDLDKHIELLMVLTADKLGDLNSRAKLAERKISVGPDDTRSTSRIAAGLVVGEYIRSGTPLIKLILDE